MAAAPDIPLESERHAAEAASAAVSSGSKAPDARKRLTKKERQAAVAAEEPPAKRPRVAAPSLVVFGLGNQGEARLRERHNVGHRVLAAVQSRKAAIPLDPPVQAAASACSIAGASRPWILLPPQGYINDSGEALRKALASLGQPAAAVLVVVDDVALPLGTIRLKAQGSSGGHNGLKSIEAVLGPSYHRLKIGIGGERSKEHVGGTFSEAEELLLETVMSRAAEAVELWLTEGPEEIQKVLCRVNNPNFCKVLAVGEPAGAAAAAALAPSDEAARLDDASEPCAGR